jgi:hypothetical protein
VIGLARVRERVVEDRILQTAFVVRRRESKKGRLATGELIDRWARHDSKSRSCGLTIPDGR